MGCPNLIVVVDHKPLVNILNNRALEKIENPRVLRLKEKTLMFDFKIVHVPGKLNCIFDVMSRLPTQNAMIFEDTKEEEIEYAAKTFTKVKALDAVNEKNPKRLNSQASLK